MSFSFPAFIAIFLLFMSVHCASTMLRNNFWPHASNKIKHFYFYRFLTSTASAFCPESWDGETRNTIKYALALQCFHCGISPVNDQVLPPQDEKKLITDNASFEVLIAHSLHVVSGVLMSPCFHSNLRRKSDLINMAYKPALILI